MRHEAVLNAGAVAGGTPTWTLRRVRHFALDNLLLLPLGALTAMVWANSAAESYYRFAFTLDFWVNDVAMVLFFGLLMKEVVEAREPGGVLHSWRKAAVPLIAATGASIAAAWMYVWFMRLTNEPMLERVWPVAITTDLAVSYFVARFLFGRHPLVAFILLFGLASNAVAFLTAPVALNPADLHPIAGAGLMALAISIAAALRNARVTSFWPYLIAAGGMAWFALYWSGIHPGLALVPIMPFLPRAHHDEGFFVEARPHAHDTLSRFELAWRYPVHLTLFMFGLVNGGVALRAIETGFWGIPVAAVVGKPLGMLAAVGFAVAIGFHLPHRVGWRELAVASLTLASGFTMALFMGAALLAPGPLLAMTRMGALLSVAAVPLAIVLGKVLRVGRFAQ
jgi:NhaA family Na+:H+ antiporter